MARMSGPVKLLLGLAATAILASVLVALFVGARRRALSSHCRNNLRHLGQIAARNWEILEPDRTGRRFWQTVREREYRKVDGTWKSIDPDPFVCPLFGKSVSQRTDPGSIDYRGPREVPEDWRTLPKNQPIGADRPGNHPDGGNVLLLDGSVSERCLVEPASGGDRLWKEAERVLSD